MANQFLVKETMADMKALSTAEITALQNGTYHGVQLLGYYEKGDLPYPMHYYESTTSESDDGGSVITLGLIKLQHRFDTTISYNQFGARLTQQTAIQDWDCIKKAHDYANKYNLRIQQSSGHIYPQYPIDVKTSLQLEGCIIHLTDSIANNNVFNIVSNKVYKNDILITQQSKLERNLDRLEDFALKSNVLVKIKSSEVLCNRIDNGVTSIEYKDDIVFVSENGYLLNSFLIHDFTDGALQVSYKECNEKHDFISDLNVIWEINNVNHWCRLLKISRSNIEIKNVQISIPNDKPINPTVFRRSLIDISDAYNVTFKNIDARNISTKQATSAYIISMENCINISFDKLVLLRGWGAFGTNKVKYININDSCINRFDIHISGADISISNTTIMGGWCVSVGYGLGYIKFNNCISDYSLIDETTFKSVFYTGGGYGLMFAGTVIINDHTIRTKGTGSKYLLYANTGLEDVDYKPAYDIEMPSLFANNIYFDNKIEESIICYGFIDNGGYYLYSSLQNNNKKLVCPQYIKVADVFKKMDSNSAYSQLVDLYVHNRLRGLVEGSTTIMGNNIEQDIHTYYTNNIPKDYDPSKNYKPLVIFNETQGIAAQTAHKLTLNNCSGGLTFFGKANYIEVKHSKLSYLSWWSTIDRSPNEIRIDNSILYPNVSSPVNHSFQFRALNLKMNNCEIFLTKYDNMDMAFYIINIGTQILMNNYFNGNISKVTQNNIDMLFSYLDSSKVKTRDILAPATTSTTGLIGQSASVANTSIIDATDLASAIALVNDLKVRFNAKLDADRNSGQQSSN